jgi:hypothetical protein
MSLGTNAFGHLVLDGVLHVTGLNAGWTLGVRVRKVYWLGQSKISSLYFGIDKAELEAD